MLRSNRKFSYTQGDKKRKKEKNREQERKRQLQMEGGGAENGALASLDLPTMDA